MADNDKKKQMAGIAKMLDALDIQANDLFKQTYSSSGINQQMFDHVSDELGDSIQRVIRGDDNYSDISNTTKLYERIIQQNPSAKESGIIGDQVNNDSGFLGFLQDNEFLASLMDTYADTKWVKVIDNEIDMCLKYMPKLQIALDIKKDNVLCADSFSKSFINTTLENSLTPTDSSKFSANSRYIIQEYDFEQKCEDWYDTASKYGEVFVYCVPYKKALQALLDRKANTNYRIKQESVVENGKSNDPRISAQVHAVMEDAGMGNATIRITMNRTGILEDAVEEAKKARDALSHTTRSVYEEFLQEASGEKVTIQMNKTIDDKLAFEDDSSSSEGLINKKQSSDKRPLKVHGCILKEIDRSRIIPIYIDDMCIGYYYIRLDVNNLVDPNTTATLNGYDSLSSMFNTETNTATSATTNNSSGLDMMLRYISGKISENIDAAFINANQDLKKEIYMILKYNDDFNTINNNYNVDVTFIPPEDIEHIKFNEDKRTHRGRSDLWSGLIAAKMWIMLNTTTVIGNVTRGQDKRVYYVKTLVETNVAKTLLNVISQIKKGNFGVRQMESINNILGIIGKFNDFVIPVGPSGDSPVQFDILPGQQFELPTDMMDRLEESAISSVVPLEIVNSSMTMDFAVRYTMTNGRLLRSILKRQAYISRPYSRIFTKIYNCEFEDNATIKVTLPPPAYMVMTQGSQLMQNAVQYVDQLADVEMQGAPDEDRNMFRIKMMRKNLSTYMDIETIDKIKEEIKIDKSIQKSTPQDEQ